MERNNMMKDPLGGIIVPACILVFFIFISVMGPCFATECGIIPDNLRAKLILGLTIFLITTASTAALVTLCIMLKRSIKRLRAVRLNINPLRRRATSSKKEAIFMKKTIMTVVLVFVVGIMATNSMAAEEQASKPAVVFDPPYFSNYSVIVKCYSPDNVLIMQMVGLKDQLLFHMCKNNKPLEELWVRFYIGGVYAGTLGLDLFSKIELEDIKIRFFIKGGIYLDDEVKLAELSREGWKILSDKRLKPDDRVMAHFDVPAHGTWVFNLNWKPSPFTVLQQDDGKFILMKGEKRVSHPFEYFSGANDLCILGIVEDMGGGARLEFWDNEEDRYRAMKLKLDYKGLLKR